MPDAIIIDRSVAIPETELRFRFSRSGGKGGQNVNKVETKAELLFDLAHSPSLTDAQRALISGRLSGMVDAEGVLHVVAQESRSQWKNRQLAVLRFTRLLQRALKPVKKRIRTKMPEGEKERRLRRKKRRGEILRSRRIEE
jgi:ribosome-associated protein